ncbi:nuclease-related domain-containing DEAD/DEAH box helicase [Kandleria vitulina]|uniref:nuclease-related domain-containing DEAD/DEAH box helicase n=1 Tax=Kandleria vitulina TaxID=1630 RepID=UPI003321D86F
MVKFIPPYIGEEVKSNAEKQMYEILQELNLEDAYVLHSLGLPRHEDKKYGEVDFVIVCKRGIACLEIKGGRVECHEGKWLFTDRYGIQRKKTEGPFAQVTGNMYSLMQALRERFKNDYHFTYFNMACGVCFPDIYFNSYSEEMIPEIIFDNSTEDITCYINEIFDYWESRHPRENTKFSKEDIEEIVDYLRGDFCFIPTLRDEINSLEKRMIRLTREQYKVIDALRTQPRILIQGGAGTGKTVLAMRYATEQATQGKKVLYLAYNKNLINSIKKQFEEYINIDVINIHALFGEYIKIDDTKVKKNPNKYFGEQMPEEFLNWVSDLSETKLNELKYDVIVIDEGQDIIKPVFLFALDSLLKDGFENGEWAIFYDEHQNIYNSEYNDGMEIIKSYNHVFTYLFVNCRNTVQIAKYTSKTSGIEINDYMSENGEEVQTLVFSENKEFKEKIKTLIRHLREEQIELSDVLFLSPKKYENSLLSQINFKVNELGQNFDEKSSLPRYATIQGIKGLDAKIIILVDVEKILDKNFSKYMYIAGTRARTMLYVIVEQSYCLDHSV